MKVLLVNPNRTYATSGTSGPKLGLPLGVLFIAASLEEQDVPVAVFDCLISPETHLITGEEITFLGVEPDVVRSVLLAEQPDIVGISCQFTAQWENTVEVVKAVHEALPRCLVVLGGPHATVSGMEILETFPEVHYIVAGEGELSFPRLVRAIESNNRAELTSIPGLMWRDEDGKMSANRVETIANLDELPLPAYHLIDFKRLFELQSEGLSARNNQFHAASIITSRGCPYSCTFCSIHLSMGHKWRAHSAEYTINHIRLLIENYGVCHLHIEDDNFTFKQERANEICRGLIREGVQLTWDTPNGVRADTLSSDLLENMKQSGCTSLSIAAESGDQSVVTHIIKKKLDLKSIERAAALACKHGIDLGCFFVIGFPGETKKQIETTLKFALKLYSKYNCYPMLNIATPLPGTELATIVREGGFLVAEMTAENLAKATVSSGSGAGMIKTPDFDPEYIQQCCVRFNHRVKFIRILYQLRHPNELYQAIRRRIMRPFKRLLLRRSQAS
jgi:anaerobic magnesium-protoporphyrin IX monomethyl ester cyclase